MSELKLLNCPFCGGKAILKSGYPFSLVICINDDCKGRIMGKTDKQAIAAWNKRQPAKDCTEYTDCHCGHCEYERQVELSRKRTSNQ